MKCLTSIALVALLAFVAQGVVDPYATANLKLLAATKTYLLGDGKYFDGATTMVQLSSAYVAVGNKEVQGFQKLTTAETQSLPSWRWNTTFPGNLGEGVASVRDVGVANQFFWIGNSVTLTGTTTTLYPIGMGDANTGAQIWTQWLPCTSAGLVQWNSTHMVGDLYGSCSGGVPTQTLTTVNLGAMGYLTNLSSIADTATPTAGGGWGVKIWDGSALVWATSRDKTGSTHYNVHVWRQAQDPTQITLSSLTSLPSIAVSCVNPRSISVLFMVFGTSVRLVTLSSSTLSAATTSLTGSALWAGFTASAVTCIAGSTADTTSVYYLRSGVFYFDTISSTAVANNWNVGSGLNFLGASGNVLSYASSVDAFFVSSNGDTLTRIEYGSTTAPSPIALPQSNLVGVPLAPGTCRMSSATAWVCGTFTSSSSVLSMLVTVNVKSTLMAKDGDSAILPVQDSIYQPATPGATWSMMVGGSMPLVAEGGMISEIGTLSQIQEDHITENPMSAGAGGTQQFFGTVGSQIVWYNATTVWGWSMATNMMAMISNVYNSNKVVITTIHASDATNLWVELRVREEIQVSSSTVIPVNTQYMCRLSTATTAHWSNVFGGTTGVDSPGSTCTRLNNFGTCGKDAMGTSTPSNTNPSTAEMVAIAGATSIAESLWLTVGGQCLMRITSSGAQSAMYFANYYQTGAVGQTAMTTAVCATNDADCGKNWRYGMIQQFQILTVNGVEAVYATLSKGTKLFETQIVAHIATSNLAGGQVYRGSAPVMGTNTDDTVYWQLPGPSYVNTGASSGGAGTSNGEQTANFAPIAILSSTNQAVSTPVLWYDGYWYFGVNYMGKPYLFCYTNSDFNTKVWDKELPGSNTASGLYPFQSLLYLEGDLTIGSFVPQQPGSQIPVRTWEAPNDKTLVNHGVDGSIVLIDSMHIASFSFLGKPQWESDICSNGTSLTTSAVGEVSAPKVLGSTVYVTCQTSSSTSARTQVALDRSTGHVHSRWNSGMGISATHLGTYVSGASIKRYYFVQIGGRNHTFTGIEVPLTTPLTPMATQYSPNPRAAPTLPVTPISGLGIENWNASFNGLKVLQTDSGFGNVYSCAQVQPASGVGAWFVSAISGSTGALLWNISVPSCTGLKSLGPVVMIQSLNQLKGVNAMSGRELYPYVSLYGTSAVPHYCNNATVFYLDGTQLYYFSVSSGQQYSLLNLADNAAYENQAWNAENLHAVVPATSSIIVTTQDYAFWVTAFGEVRAFLITQADAYGATSAVSANPAGTDAVVVRTGTWGTDVVTFPSVESLSIPNSTVAVLLQWSTTSMPWKQSIVPNTYARARKQQDGVDYSAIDWGVSQGTPVVVFIEERWIQAFFVNGTNAGSKAYSTGIQFWWLRMSPLLPITGNTWYLTDERANFHTFDVNSGTFNNSFQLQAPNDVSGFPNIYAPRSTVHGVGLTSKSLFVGFVAQTSALQSTGGVEDLWIYRIDLSGVGSATAPTAAFASLYATSDSASNSVKKIGVIQTTISTETVVVVGEYQAAAVSFETGSEIVAYPVGQTISGNSWTPNVALSRFYTGTANGYAQCVDKANRNFGWNVSLTEAGRPYAEMGKTFGTEGFLTADGSKYILATNNASVCMFDADVSGTGGQGFFGTNAVKETCVNLRTKSTAIGKKCTFTNAGYPFGNFFVESGGFVYFSSSSSNCIFQISLSAPKVSAVMFRYSFSKAPVAAGGGLVFSDGVYVYKLASSAFTEAVGNGATMMVLATGATTPVEIGGSIYVGTTDGLVCINAGSMAVQWKYPTKARVVRQPVAVGGNILVGDSLGYIYAVQTNGLLAWSLLAGYNPQAPLSTYPVIDTVVSAATGTFLWITSGGFVAYDNNGVVKWSDFVDTVTRNYGNLNSFTLGRIFPQPPNCGFNLDVRGVTLYSKCSSSLVAADIATGQILFESGMPGDRFAVSGTTLTYPGHTKIVEQTVVLPEIATPVPGMNTPAPAVWGYVATLDTNVFERTKFVNALSTVLRVDPDTVRVGAINRQVSGDVVVEFQFVGVQALAAYGNFNQLPAAQLFGNDVGIVSYSPVDAEGIVHGKTTVTDVNMSQTAVIVMLVLIFLIAIAGLVILVLVMARVGGSRAVGGAGRLDAEMDDQHGLKVTGTVNHFTSLNNA